MMKEQMIAAIKETADKMRSMGAYNPLPQLPSRYWKEIGEMRQELQMLIGNKTAEEYYEILKEEAFAQLSDNDAYIWLRLQRRCGQERLKYLLREKARH